MEKMQPDGTNEFESVGGQPGRRRRGLGGFAETTGQSSLKPAKPISFVLGRFYHGAVYHRLPRQCRCCSHCERHGNVVLTYIPLPSFTPSSNGPAEKIDRTRTPFRYSPPCWVDSDPPIPEGQSLLLSLRQQARNIFRDSADSEEFVPHIDTSTPWHSNLFSRTTGIDRSD